MPATSRSSAFSLLEILAALAIVSVLVTLILIGIQTYTTKAGIAGCMANLRTIHVGLGAMHTDLGRWVQVPEDLDEKGYSNFWRSTLSGYGVAEASWRCPTARKVVKRTAEDEKWALDYAPAQFSDTPGAATKASKQPWVVESGDYHGDGNLLITTSGETLSVNEFFRRQTGKNPPWGK